jgi:EAL domain-containing protein (putative c-di-GMP-specific phosphodiesterase class I)
MPHSPPISSAGALILPAPNIEPVPPLSARRRSVRHDAAERRRLTRRLRHALAAGDLLLHYQPLVALSSGRIRGAEALVRLRHHRLGLLAPSHFMPGAEQDGIVHEIGGWLLDQACAEAAAWPEPACVAVTLAPRQVQHRKFIQRFLQRLGRTGIPPERLECTLTETMLTDPNANMEFSLKALQGLGVRLALANFRAASVSLPALRRLRLTTLRLDRALTCSLDNGPASHALIRDTIKAGHDLGCWPMASTPSGNSASW